MADVKRHLNRHDWVQLHSELLEEERKAEVQAAQIQVEGLPAKVLEARGVLLGRLVVAERSTGLYGRPVVTFAPERNDATLPANNFSAGDIVGVCEGPNQVATGVVVEVGDRRVSVAGDEEGREDLDGLEDDARITLRKLASEVTYRRIKAGLTQLSQEINSSASHLIALLFGEAPPRPEAPRLPPKLTSSSGDLQLLNERLDESQRKAVEFALKRSDLAVIHGPPGTGKTTTLVEVIRQHTKMGCKVLVCAPSNLAVDNLVERLAAAKVRLVRLGHPARVTALTQRHTLDAILHNSEEWRVLGDIRAEMEGELGRLRKTRGGDQRRHIRSNVKSLRKELREKETRLVQQVLLGSEVILATLTSSSNDGPLRHLPSQHLDLVVIDECSQATEASCYMAIMRAPKLVLAGDHCQLPPTIVSTEAAAKGMELSLMERVIAECGEEVVQMLTQQYRMNSAIMQWSSEAMYQGRLTAHPSVASHLLSHLPGVTPTEDTESVAVVVDTAGCECWELDTSDAQSKGNPDEAVLVACHVNALINAGVPQSAIAVITPYNLQVEMIRGLLASEHPSVEVRSVDGFQGREKEAIVVSLVRSNKHGTVGFLSEDRRLNVAITRARRHVALIGDSETAGRHPFIQSLFKHLTDCGVVKTAYEFQHELDTTDVRTPESISWTTKAKAPVKGNQKTQPKPQQPSEEENLKRKEEYLGILKSFLESSSSTHSFSSNLNSYERRLVHQICEELSLNHCSEGVGKDRFIVVKKREENETIGSKEDQDSEKGRAEENEQESINVVLVGKENEEVVLAGKEKKEKEEKNKDVILAGKEKMEKVKEKGQGVTKAALPDTEKKEKKKEEAKEKKKEDNDVVLADKERMEHKEMQKMEKVKRKEDSKIILKDKEKMESKEDQEEEKEENEDIENTPTKQDLVLKMTATIDAFIISPEERLKLPSKTSALERDVARDVCEERGLTHYTEGKGKRRHMVIQKRQGISTIEHQDDQMKTARTSDITRELDLLPTSQDTARAPQNSQSHSNAQTGAVPKETQEKSLKKVRTRYIDGRYVEVTEGDDAAMRTCAVCGKDVPLQNYSLHSVQCERRGREAQQDHDMTSKIDNAKKKSSRKEKGKKSNSKKKGKEEEEEDFDALIDKFVKANNTCSQPHCKTPTSVIYQLCPFCRCTFCLAHHMAEVHGCGPLARQQARTVISREGVLYPGSGVPSKKPAEDKRKQLERKLAKKMGDFSANRTVKKPAKEKD